MIDYNLTRRFDASRKQDPVERELVVFQAGNHRFVEVKCDKEDNYKWRDGEEIHKSSRNCQAPATLKALKLLSRNWIHWPGSSM